MKKTRIAAILLVGVMMLPLAGCRKKTEDSIPSAAPVPSADVEAPSILSEMEPENLDVVAKGRFYQLIYNKYIDSGLDYQFSDKELETIVSILQNKDEYSWKATLSLERTHRKYKIDLYKSSDSIMPCAEMILDKYHHIYLIYGDEWFSISDDSISEIIEAVIAGNGAGTYTSYNSEEAAADSSVEEN